MADLLNFPLIKIHTRRGTANGDLGRVALNDFTPPGLQAANSSRLAPEKSTGQGQRGLGTPDRLREGDVRESRRKKSEPGRKSAPGEGARSPLPAAAPPQQRQRQGLTGSMDGPELEEEAALARRRAVQFASAGNLHSLSASGGGGMVGRVPSVGDQPKPHRRTADEPGSPSQGSSQRRSRGGSTGSAGSSGAGSPRRPPDTSAGFGGSSSSSSRLATVTDRYGSRSRAASPAPSSFPPIDSRAPVSTPVSIQPPAHQAKPQAKSRVPGRGQTVGGVDRTLRQLGQQLEQQGEQGPGSHHRRGHEGEGPIRKLLGKLRLGHNQ